MFEIALPYSEDGFYRFGDLPWLISASLTPDDESAKDWIRCVLTWRDDGTAEGQFARRLAPEGAKVTCVQDCNAWPAIPVELMQEPADRSRSNLFQWLWRAQRRSAEWQVHFDDGSLFIHADCEPNGTVLDLTRMGHQENYERALTSAVEHSLLTVCNSSGLPHSFPLGKQLRDSVVHISELNRWGSTQQGGQHFAMATSARNEAGDAAHPDFAIPLMPTEVPCALLSLHPDSMISYATGLSIGRSSGRTTVGGLIEMIRDRMARRQKNRYSLIEAATILGTEAGEEARQMLESLAAAAIENRLIVHQKERNATFDASKEPRSSARHLETTAGSLNSWLAEHHPLIAYRFPTPASLFAASSDHSYTYRLELPSDIMSLSLDEAVSLTAKTVLPDAHWIQARMQRNIHMAKLLEAIDKKSITPLDGGLVPEYATNAYQESHRDKWLLSVAEFKKLCSILGISLVNSPIEITSDYLSSPSKPETEPEQPTNLQPVQRQQAQESAILTAISSEGHDPKCLPKNQQGRPGVKAAVRAKVMSDHSSLFPQNSTTFDKAWERLRSRGELKDRP